ncbi:MAG TPA: hypothetical protein VEA41_13075, partial [Salinarimonas sp.]|nr:hypothetical protein [Salinarimonas sp.]
PFVRGDHVQAAIRLVRNEGWEVGTVATPIRSRAEWEEPAVVKVVRGDDGRALPRRTALRRCRAVAAWVEWAAWTSESIRHEHQQEGRPFGRPFLIVGPSPQGTDQAIIAKLRGQ